MADMKDLLGKAQKIMENTDLDEKLIDQAKKEVKKTKKVDDNVVNKIADMIDGLDGKPAKRK